MEFVKIFGVKFVKRTVVAALAMAKLMRFHIGLDNIDPDINIRECMPLKMVGFVVSLIKPIQ